MKNKLMTISTLLIIVLVGILVEILIKYYNTPIKVSNRAIELNNSSNASLLDNPPVVNNFSKSGELISDSEIQSNTVQQTIITDSGEINSRIEFNNNNSSDVSEIKDKNNVVDDIKSEKNNQVIITSEDTMTNKEKREILTELDNTLMELLDVVDKVQTVDETRLITDESEVQK